MALRGLLIFLVAGNVASAQSLTGTVTDSATHQPIPGVVISLLDSTGGLLGRLLTTDRGTYHVPQASPVHRLRLQRIGYRVRDAAVASGEGNRRLDVQLAALPSLLDPVNTVASSRCPKRADARSAFALLDQARAALLNTIVARDQNPGRMVRLQYQRLFDGDRTLKFSVRVDSVFEAKPSFSAVLSGADFARVGFMDSRGDGQRFYGPDAEVLLDDGFAAGYCFRIADADRSRRNQVGLAFSAADRKHGRVDIEGTLWIDSSARAMRDIEYRYVGLPSGTRGHAEGMTSFREIPNGVVFIDRWFIRIPEEQIDQTGSGILTTWWASNESGGEVAHASWPDGAHWDDSLGSLRLLAVHRDQKSPAGTTVRLLDTDYLGVADAAGNIVIPDLLPGPYKAAVVDSTLASVHILPEPFFRFVVARDSTVALTFEVKTPADYAYDRCVGNKPAGAANSIMLLGKIEDATGSPVKGALLEFATVGSEPFANFKTGDDGVFSLCLPASTRTMSLAVWFRDANGRKQNSLVTLRRELSTMLINIGGR